MSNVIPLRPPNGTAARKPTAPDRPRYFCLACDTDHFKIYADGTVHCASCGSLIRNVTTTQP